MCKLATILDFSLKCLGCTMMIVICVYNIVLMWNGNFVFKTEVVVLFTLLIALCSYMLCVTIKEFKQSKGE